MTCDYTTVMRAPTTPRTSRGKAASPRKRPGKALANAAAAKAAAKRRKRDGLTPEEIEAIFFRFHQVEPEPKGELESVNAFTLLVAVVLSAQATDVGVNKATRPLFQVADTPQKMVALGEEKLTGYIKTIGLWRGKAKNVIALSKIILEQHGGKTPRTREDLVALPGVAGSQRLQAD